MKLNILAAIPYTETLALAMPDGVDLSYTDADGKVCGGIQGIIGPYPPPDGVQTCIVQVDTSPSVVDKLKAAVAWWEEVPDAEEANP